MTVVMAVVEVERLQRVLGSSGGVFCHCLGEYRAACQVAVKIMKGGLPVVAVPEVCNNFLKLKPHLKLVLVLKISKLTTNNQTKPDLRNLIKVLSLVKI